MPKNKYRNMIVECGNMVTIERGLFLKDSSKVYHPKPASKRRIEKLVNRKDTYKQIYLIGNKVEIYCMFDRV